MNARARELRVGHLLASARRVGAMTDTNRRITLAKRPVGEVSADCFAIDEVDIPTPGPGEVLAEVGWLSIDPTIRGWMAMDTYLPAIEIGAEIRSGGLATVIESNNDDIPVGATLFGMTGWQQYAIMDGSNQIVPDGHRSDRGVERVRRDRDDGVLRIARGRAAGRGRDRARFGRCRRDRFRRRVRSRRSRGAAWSGSPGPTRSAPG